MFSRSRRVKKILPEVRRMYSGGVTIHSSLARYKAVFPNGMRLELEADGEETVVTTYHLEDE